MKTNRESVLLLTLLLVLGSQLGAASQDLATTPASPSTNDATAPSLASYSIVARTSNSRTWEWTPSIASPFSGTISGKAVTNKHRYVELATGLYYPGQNSTWQPSTETISLLPAAVGGAATNAPHNVFFPADIYNGWIQILCASDHIVRGI